jgi:REG-2-like HAD superfamily hydrolase
VFTDVSDTVLFTDLAGTLIRPKPPVPNQYREAALDIGYVEGLPSVERIETRFRVAFERVQLPGEQLRYGQTLAEGRWFWKRIIGSVFPGLPDDKLTTLTDKLFKQFSHASAWTIYPDAKRVLRKLKSLDVKLGLISNFDARGPQLLRNLQLSDLFRTAVFSSEVGVEKPDKQIFQLAADGIGDGADRIVMIGNSVSADLRTPEEMGWDTLLHTPGSGDSWKNEVSSWEEVLNYLTADSKVRR